MNAQDRQDTSPNPLPKAPYTRPELKRLGKLRDITANTSPGAGPE
jgi:hypothetical protein